MKQTVIERFEAKFEPCPITGCFLWNACTNADGYGFFRYGGKPQRAHRVAYEIYVREVPEGLCVCHRCDVPWCVNPEHLFLGTRLDNNVDRDRKDRGNTAKLTSEQAREIYQRVHAGERQTDIASAYQINRVTVSDIKLGKIWAHVTKGNL